MTDHPAPSTWTPGQKLDVLLAKVDRLENILSVLNDKLARFAALWEADEENDAAVLASVVRERDAARAELEAARANDTADAARIAELEADVAAADAQLSEMLAAYEPVEPFPVDTGTEDTGTEDTGTEDTGTEEQPAADVEPEPVPVEPEAPAEGE